ncbi:hypothetical protein BRADI_1g76250v3 [Brachypodium distachyon]|uniref:Uncharacterized protein n=1 Tax=Brachypodium distachyon TaxID=15368 RepID=I1HA35_BRADI|nr:hypothetical protein BRADI_1g76250v3 [Brachypodium distachyon]
MAMGFRRRLVALAVPKASSYIRRTRQKKLSYTRVASLPGRFHPAVAGLHDAASELLAWTETPPAQACSKGWIGDGVGRLGRVLAGLTDLLHHPQAARERDPLRRMKRRPSRRAAAATPWTERLLDDLLLLADAHGCAREALVALKPLLAEAHAAVRRRDAARLAAALRARRRSDRDLARLAATLRALSHRSYSSSSTTADSGGEATLASAVAAATCAAAAASAAIFAGLASASTSSASAPSSSPASKAAGAPVWWVADLLRWRRRTGSVVAACESGSPPGAAAVPPEEKCCADVEEEERKAAMERLRDLEDCVVAAEEGCEQVYRALVNARVSLLNVLTPCF